VYNVFLGDRDGFVNAIKSAAENPIERSVVALNLWIPPLKIYTVMYLSA
jgi:hypothetical protein